VRGGFQPPKLATVSTTSKSSTPAKGKPKADDEDTTETQRDDGFTKVSPKRLSKPAQKAHKRKNAASRNAAAATTANTKVPGSELFAHITPIPKALTHPEESYENIIFSDDHHLASIRETTDAFKALFPLNLASSEDNLRRTNMEWGSTLDDSMLCNLISLPAWFAVKSRLPLTAHLTKEAMRAGLSESNATNYIENMTTVCGVRLPLQYTQDHLGPNE